jgi:hypothetical protein
MKYVLNLNTSICMEAHGDCVVDMVIFKNTTLPKLICDWSSGFTIPGQALINIYHLIFLAVFYFTSSYFASSMSKG